MIRFLALCILLLAFCLPVSAQYKLQLVVNSLPEYHAHHRKIYLTGNFNNWNPGDNKMVLSSVHGKPGITIELPKGMYQFKLTGGSWDKVESDEGGFPTANHHVDLESDTTLEIEVKHWADHFPPQEKHSTASDNVCVLDSSFFIPQLNRYRRVWVYMPASYCNSRKKYPVLYMHDGQNVFDNATSGFGEWGVDEALDSIAQSGKEMIVVAIDNGGEKRINEYAPYDMEKYGKGEGDLYVEFLVKTLKPYMDKNFRTYRDAKNTFVAGSSMGGIISFYAMLKYPKVFGAAGVFSPAFWINPQLKDFDTGMAKKLKGRIYFFAGQQESEEMVPDMLYVFERMRTHSKAKMKTVIRAEGKHNEETWRTEVPGFVNWLLDDRP